MKQVLYNYSSLMHRETKIYSIGGTAIPGGLSVNFIKVVAPCTILSFIIGFALSFVFGINMVDPFGATRFNWQYLLAWLLLGIISGLILWNVQFAGYRLYEYLLSYLRPKRVYNNNLDLRKRNVTFYSHRINTTVRQHL